MTSSFWIASASMAMFIAGCQGASPPTSAPAAEPPASPVAAAVAAPPPLRPTAPPVATPIPSAAATPAPTATAAPVATLPPTSVGSDDPTLARFIGEYPSALIGDRKLAYRARIDALLGKDKRLYHDRSVVEVPAAVEATGVARYLVLHGCMAHACTVEESVVLVNLASGKIHVAVLQEGTKVRTWSEPGQAVAGGKSWDELTHPTP